MTQNEKDLLLKDLCARLPYGVKIAMPGLWDSSKITIEPLNEIFKGDDGLFRANGNGHCIEYIKPYLFPLSSMTEEQKYDFYCRFIENDCDFNDFKEFYLDGGMWHKLLTSLDDTEAIIDWFHKNHFDYRGLIERGLAIDATGLNIY